MMLSLHPDRSDPNAGTDDGARSDERYRPLFALSPRPAWVYDCETLRFLEVNEAAVAQYGWSREEFLTMTLGDVRPPEEHAHLRAMVAQSEGHERFSTAAVHRTRSGHRRRVEVCTYPLMFDGRSARMVLVLDVTDHFETQEALVRSEQKYRSVIEQFRDVFFRTDQLGLWTFLNSAWTTLTGYSVDDSLGMHCLTHVHPADRAVLLDALRPLAEGALPSTHVEVRFFHREGGCRWVEVSTHAARDGGGRIDGTMGTLRDVTERRTAEEERHRLATDIRQLLDASGEGIYGIDTHGVINFVNKRGAEMIGYQPSELVGRRMHELAHYARPDGTPYPESECPICRAAMHGIPCSVDDEVLWRKDGVPLQVEYTASPVRSLGEISGAVVNFRDTTARKRAEIELVVARDAAEAANRAKSDFLARMSHELRTPLNSIIGFANVLLKNRAGSMRQDDLTYLSRVAANGQHLLGLIDDILDLSKIEAGHMSLDLGTVALDALVRDTVDELEGQTRDRSVVVRAELPPRVRPIETDAGRIKQVLINLIGNAIKFTERGEIVVRLETDASDTPTLIEVRDSGIGIPSARFDAIFNAFEQAESMITRRYGGTGLGLAISRSLCDLMGHRLEVRSVEGVGTTMGVRLGHRNVASGTPASGGRATHPPLALLIDDDAGARATLSARLVELGCRAVGATTGVEGLRLARELRPALIFLDLRLPHITAFDVLRILRTDGALRATPVVVMSETGSPAPDGLIAAAERLDKPVDRARLAELLARLVPGMTR
jgi:PAS domain S-box-containing protein